MSDDLIEKSDTPLKGSAMAVGSTPSMLRTNTGTTKLGPLAAEQTDETRLKVAVPEASVRCSVPETFVDKAKRGRYSWQASGAVLRSDWFIAYEAHISRSP